jgi:hypothetical protein
MLFVAMEAQFVRKTSDALAHELLASWPIG